MQGSPVTYNGYTLSFDLEARLKTFDNAGIFGAGYSASGLRAWQEQAGQGIPKTYYLYDGITPVVEFDGSGSVLAVNTFGANGLVSRFDASQSLSGIYRFDERGNVVDIGFSNQSVPSVGPNVYTAFGPLLSGVNFVHGFGGKWGYQTDPATGLILCTFRYYDPNTGRWLTRDPIGYDGGINLYGYCAGNPVTKADPGGLDGATILNWDGQHMTILLPISFWGAGASKEMIDRATASIEKTWSGKIGDYNISTIVIKSKPGKKFCGLFPNSVQLANWTLRSNRSTWSTTGEFANFDIETVARHETGHLLGLLDEYSNPDKTNLEALKNSLMNKNMNGDVLPVHVDEILQDRGNRVTPPIIPMLLRAIGVLP